MFTRNIRNSLTNFHLSKAYSSFSNKPCLGHVLIGGGTGFIGSNLREMLLRENYQVTVISRVKTGVDIINWADIIKTGIPNNVNAIVNLTGEPIMVPFKKFSKGYKKQIWISRVGSTTLLADIINYSKYKPDTFISVTSTDIYPINGVYWENFQPSDSMTNSDYFTKLSTDWEKSIKSTSNSVRQILIRTGTVLGHDGGFMKWLNYTTKMRLGSLGNGCQYQPWIHMCDLIYLILFSIENNQINGVLNGVSPEKITNGHLTTMYAQMLKRSIKLNINETILKTIYGKERSKLLLEGKQVLPTRTLMCGFEFEYCEIEKALKHLLCQK